MREILPRTFALVLAFALFVVIFVLVMFFVNPAIDGGNGMDLLRLQLAFAKIDGMRIVQAWGETGVRNFRKLIVFDYLYAVSYVLLLVTAIGYFAERCEGKLGRLPIIFTCLAVLAGLFDMLENTLEIFFLNDLAGFPSALFFGHSIVAVLKWMMVLFVVGYIVALGVKGTTGNGSI